MRAWFDCYLRAPACDGRADRRRRRVRRSSAGQRAASGRPAARRRPTIVAFPGVTTFARSGKAVRTSAPLRKRDRGLRRADGARRRSQRAAAGRGSSPCSRPARRRARRSSSAPAACRRSPARRRSRSSSASQATFVPKGSRLTLTLASSSTAQSTREPPLPRPPDAAERSRTRRHRRPQAAGPAHAGHEVIARAAAVALVALALVASGRRAPRRRTRASRRRASCSAAPCRSRARRPRSARSGPGAKAYFDYVNAKGGVNGRKIEYRYYDDAYNPAQTVQLTRRLVEQDKVFAVFNSVGTANNLAIRDYLNAQKVPQLFAADGSQSIGRSFARYPWTMGFLRATAARATSTGRRS